MSIIRTVLATLLFATSAIAQTTTITLAWDAPNDATVTGYVVAYGTTSGMYPTEIDVHNVTTTQIANLDSTKAYFFVVRSYNASGTRSNASNEVVYRPPTPPPPPPEGAYSIWPLTQIGSESSDSSPVELGTRFSSDQVGSVFGARFYKTSSLNAGPHVVSLWSATGTLLARATTTNETANGWQSVTFASPVTIQANTPYVVSYFASASHWSYILNYFTQPHDAPPLHAFVDSSTTPNGAYLYASAPVFPNRSYAATNYLVDVMVAIGSQPPPSTLTITCPANVTATSATVTYPPAVATGGVPPLTVLCMPSSNTVFPIGTSTVTCTAHDNAAATATCSFTVTVPSLPNGPTIPTNPNPANGQQKRSINQDLAWTGCSDCQYRVAFGTVLSPPVISDNITNTTYALPQLAHRTRYYWSITAIGANGQSVTGPIWTFTTK